MRNCSPLVFALTRGGLTLAFVTVGLMSAEGCDCGDVLNPIGDGGTPPAACTLADNDACEGNQVMKQGQCAPSGCEVETDCCPGTRCRLDLNTCWPYLLDGDYACEDDADCDDPGQRCREVAVGPRDPLPICVYDRCEGDAECGEGRSCFHSVCVAKTPCGGGCEDGEVCDVITGQCAPVPEGAVGCSTACDGIRVLADPDIMAGEICCPTVCQCKQLPPIVPTRFGRYSRVALSGNEVAVSAYDAEYGDLVVVYHKTDGSFSRIQYLDGVPTGGEAVADPNGPRGGVREPGPDVGTHTSIASDANGRLRIAYHDNDNKALRVAIQIPGDWTTYTLDTASGDDARVGTFTDIGVADDGTIWVSYLVDGVTGTPGIAGPANGLKVARSLTADPRSATDWQFFYADVRGPFDACDVACSATEACVLDGSPTCKPTAASCPGTCNASEACVQLDQPDADGNTSACTPGPLPVAPAGKPRARGLHTALITDGTGALVAHYDGIDGDLRLVELTATGQATVHIIDGDGQDGRRSGDVGRFPSLQKNGSEIFLSYADFSRHQLVLWRGALRAAGERTVIDDGLSADAPGQAFVGAGSRLVLAGGGPLIVYQDASSLDLKLAEQGEGGAFSTQVLLREGAHGFYSDVVANDASAFIVSVQARVDARGQEASRLTVLPRALP